MLFSFYYLLFSFLSASSSLFFTSVYIWVVRFFVEMLCVYVGEPVSLYQFNTEWHVSFYPNTFIYSIYLFSFVNVNDNILLIHIRSNIDYRDLAMSMLVPQYNAALIEKKGTSFFQSCCKRVRCAYVSQCKCEYVSFCWVRHVCSTLICRFRICSVTICMLFFNFFALIILLLWVCDSK